MWEGEYNNVTMLNVIYMQGRMNMTRSYFRVVGNSYTTVAMIYRR